MFRDEWAAVERELAMSRDPEELEALSSRDDLDEVYAYLDNVERVVRAGLLTMDPTWRGDRASLGVGTARAIAAINVFESSIPAEEGFKPPSPFFGGVSGACGPCGAPVRGPASSAASGSRLPTLHLPWPSFPEPMSAPRGTLHGVVSPRVPCRADSVAPDEGATRSA